MENYTYRAQWSPEYLEYVGTCVEFPLEFVRAPTAHEAIEGIERTVAAIVTDYLDCGTNPPPSLTDRRYSGNFLVRTSPALHARLMVEAAEQGVSLNHWAVQRLADRKPSLSIDDLF
jgi:predicted HicB family RNase H-like nuclease